MTLFKLLIAALLIIIGLRSIVVDLRTIIWNEAPDIDRNSVLSKKLLSPYTRYWIGRYYAPFQGIVSGLLLIGFGVALYLY